MEHGRLRAEIEELMARVDKAWNAADAVSFAELWAPDGTVANPMGQLSAGRAGIRADIDVTVNGGASGSRHKLTINRVYPVGPEVAFVEGEAAVLMANESSPWRSSFVAVCARQPDGVWAIAHLRSFLVGGSG